MKREIRCSSCDVHLLLINSSKTISDITPVCVPVCVPKVFDVTLISVCACVFRLWMCVGWSRQKLSSRSSGPDSKRIQLELWPSQVRPRQPEAVALLGSDYWAPMVWFSPRLPFWLVKINSHQSTFSLSILISQWRICGQQSVSRLKPLRTEYKWLQQTGKDSNRTEQTGLSRTDTQHSECLFISKFSLTKPRIDHTPNCSDMFWF